MLASWPKRKKNQYKPPLICLDWFNLSWKIQNCFGSNSQIVQWCLTLALAAFSSCSVVSLIRNHSQSGHQTSPHSCATLSIGRTVD